MDGRISPGRLASAPRGYIKLGIAGHRLTSDPARLLREQQVLEEESRQLRSTRQTRFAIDRDRVLADSALAAAEDVRGFLVAEALQEQQGDSSGATGASPRAERTDRSGRRGADRPD